MPSTERGSFFERLACADFDDEFEQRFLVVFSNQYFASLLAVNPHYHARVRSTFGIDVFGALERFLLPQRALRPALATPLVDFVTRQLPPRAFVVGLQVRYLYYDSRPMPAVDFLPNIFRLARLLSDDARATAAPRALDVVWLLATDSADVRAFAARVDGDHRLVHYDAALPDDNHRFSADNVEARVVDNYLLSHADVLVLTNPSSFGYIASARRAGGAGMDDDDVDALSLSLLSSSSPLPRPPLPAHYVVSGKTAHVRRALSFEPCLYFWDQLPTTSCYSREHAELFQHSTQDLADEQNCEF